MRPTPAKNQQALVRRKLRTRQKIKRLVDNGRLRLSVFRSSQHIYAQVIDDNKGQTMVAASSKALALTGNKTEQAKAVGETLAERALKKGIKNIIFDRGAYKYHGRIKALAEAARAGGLEF